MPKLYSCFDRVAGVFADPFVAQNDAVAVRKFKFILDTVPMVNKDCDLYCVSPWEPEHGVVQGDDNEVVRSVERGFAPRFVSRYVPSVSNDMKEVKDDE